MSDTSETQVINLKLFIDEEKNKVVFAEAGKDFVDILFSFLTLPMGTIVRLIEKYHKSESKAIGCFNNIYSSVVNMEIKHFRTEACKEMLLYPKSLNHGKCQNLKLIDDCEAKCFMCPNVGINELCGKHYSNFNTTRCSCGKLMSKVIDIDNDGGRVSGGNDHTSFIITDDLKVQVSSSELAVNVLKDLGYTNWDKLAKRVYNVNCKEIVTFLESLLTSDTPLTNTFLMRVTSSGMERFHKMLNHAICKDWKESKDDQTIMLNSCVNKKEGKSLSTLDTPLINMCLKRVTYFDTEMVRKMLKVFMLKNSKESKDNQTIMLNACVNKKEGKIVYVECGEDFVDLLLTFLAMPLEYVWKTSGNKSIFGCIGNLSKSFKDLRNFGREAICVLPYYYKCQNQLLDIVTNHMPPTYSLHFSSATNSTVLGMKVVSIDPKSEGDSHSADGSTTPTGGFVKRGIQFLVTDDLRIVLSNLTSSIGLLKGKQIQFEDVEVQAIIIRKEEAMRLLEASLMTFSAVSTALLAMKPASTSYRHSQVLKTPKTEL